MMSSAPNTLRYAAAPIDSSAAAPPRMPGLDILRAGAAVAVVALHAGIPYMTHPLPVLEWCVRSSELSTVVDALCWAINIAVMPTFFLMGGALAAGVWQRNPGQAFLIHRTRRLLLPLAFATLFVLPADMYVWLIGWFTQGLIPWRKVLSIKLPSPLSEQFWGVAHLWYLECLWTLSVIAWVVHIAVAKLLPCHREPRQGRCYLAVGVSPRADAPNREQPGSGDTSRPAASTLRGLECARAVLRVLTNILRPRVQVRRNAKDASARAGRVLNRGTPGGALPQLLTILAGGLLLALDPTFLIGFQQAWWPGPAAIAFYGVFFAAGWRQGGRSRAVASKGERCGVIQLSAVPSTGYRILVTPSRSSGTSAKARLILSAGLFAVLLPQIHHHTVTPFTGLNLIALTTAFAACSWLAATGLFAVARSFRTTALPRPVAFIAEASFWMYLVHHPFVGLTQLALLNASLSPIARFGLSLTAGIGLSLGSYVVLVRGTWIGRLLDGRGLSRPVVSPMPAVEEPLRRAA